jgi:hypothetical protein
MMAREPALRATCGRCLPPRPPEGHQLCGDQRQPAAQTPDALERLQTAQASGGTGGTYAPETYTYDQIGNLKAKPGVGVYTYTASATGCVAGTPSLKPHAVRYAGSYSFTYDCNGNMLTRNDSTGNFTQQWDKENRLITVTGASATGYFVYDGDPLRCAPRAIAAIA